MSHGIRRNLAVADVWPFPISHFRSIAPSVMSQFDVTACHSSVSQFLTTDPFKGNPLDTGQIMETNVASPTLVYRSGTQVKMMIWHSLAALARAIPIDRSLSGSVYPNASSRMRGVPPSLATIIEQASRKSSESCSLVPPLNESNGTVIPFVVRPAICRSSFTST